METDQKLRFEHDLLNRYLTWLLSSESVLFAAYGLTFAKDATLGDPMFFRQVTAGSGLAIAIVILVGVVAGIMAKLIIRREANLPQLGVRTWITAMALLADISLPLTFAVAWALILCHS
jgi:hypothetical protein